MGLVFVLITCPPPKALSADAVVGIYGAQVMSQGMLWIAQEAGLFAKHNLNFQLIYIASSGMVTAALLGGDADLASAGGVGAVRAYIQGATDLVFIGAIKNVLTQSLLAKPDIKRPEDLRSKKIGVTRIGSNTHYFTVQALRQKGMEPGRDFTFIQTGGEPETIAALSTGSVDAAAMSAPADAKALALGFRYVVYGPDLRIPQAAQMIVTRRSLISRRPEVLARFMRALAEGTNIMHTDREFTYKVVGKMLRVTDRKILDAAYNVEIKAIEPKLDVNREGIQATLEEIAQTDPRAKKVKPAELIDRRYLDEMETSGFFARLAPRR
jgi:ABC-type nitrate/sulfonate/bicarbonate transport system substrate-binding protein